MIRAYSTSPESAAALEQAAQHKGYPLEIQVEFDAEALAARLGEISVLVLDFTNGAFPVDRTLAQLNAFDHDTLPPVLYLLSGPADVAHIAAAENIINQDYTFAPISAENLALRLEVLTLLGSRRRLTMESVITDKLTGLFNRKYFLRRVEEEMYRALRYTYNVGMILVDVDFRAGDGSELAESDGTEVVRSIADFFQGRLRRTDVIARFRWSEFAVLLPDISAEDSQAVARDLKQKIEALNVTANGHPLKLKAAVGQLTFPAAGISTALDAVEALEECCFKAKSGSGEVENYEPALTS